MTPPRTAWIVGTFDTKAEELLYLARAMTDRGVRVVTVDVGTRSHGSLADISADYVAQHHPRGRGAVLENPDRGSSVIAMSEALCELVRLAITRGEVDGMIALGGSGGTSLIAPAMRLLRIGSPKLMVSTLASGDVGPFVDCVDMTMMYPVTDIAGLNRLSRAILLNAGHAMAGMMLGPLPAPSIDDKPAIASSMFGVTTPCVQAVRALLEGQFDIQTFHANGPGGRAMESLAAAGMVQAIVDLTTTEIVQHIVGGVCDAGAGRLESAAVHNLPWVGSVGALDMVNWGAPPSVPAHFRNRTFHAHNANVTLMRTNADELAAAGKRIAAQLNRSKGPVRLLLPLHGVSMLDAVGQPFFAPGADAVLFETLDRCFERSATHQLIALPFHINDVGFAQAVAAQVLDLVGCN